MAKILKNGMNIDTYVTSNFYKQHDAYVNKNKTKENKKKSSKKETQTLLHDDILNALNEIKKYIDNNNIENLNDYMSNTENITEEITNINNVRKCPYCNSENFKENFALQPFVFEGSNTNEKTTYFCSCLDCHMEFSFKE